MCDNIENSPGKRAMEIMETIHKDIVFKKPIGVPRRRSKMKVLDEESYVEAIGKIIERDFFPDLEKLKAQNEYLDAVDRNDTIKLRELYMKYSGSKPPAERIPSPATFETPANIHNTQIVDKPPATPEIVDVETTEKTKEKRLSLDQYLNLHTSQDNESFEEIIVESEKKHREKYSYLYNEEDKSEEEQAKLLALPSIEIQALPVEKKFNVDTWGYKNKNYIMYTPDGVSLTEAEQQELNSKRHEVVYLNTRLSVNPFNDVQSKETINELAKTQAKVLDGKIGVDGKELLKVDTPKIGGFGFVRSPSPSPSLLGSPLMTWGQIEGTPFRLDGSDTPLSRAQGPSFKMSEPPRREQLALVLAEKVGEKNRNQKKKNIEAQRRQLASPSPRPNTSAIDRLATMSPAARKLATSRLKLGVNSNLRSVYSPSPLARLKTPTPVRSPKRLSTPKVKARKPVEVSTDDLLKINLPKRHKASDFF
ncbi:hypothetical protein NQ315_002425 [Exocentrus adspersus]|uniref:Uncharacterized protein n=1 Tax=Exocentrus adspersus TaxID=1586481 RepID=A0AAV8VSN7_9CUCU|nr:hypothetical protein NQ315_002425 [Exocentrus adspersus]